MADSVGSHSLYGTSAVLVDQYCDPCFNKDGVTRQAIAFCIKCIEFYCKSCLESHDRIGITKQHKILRGSDMPSSQADKPIKYCLCDHHDERMDQYCLDHCVILCKHCVVSKHKKCEVKSVEVSVQMSDFKHVTQLPEIHHPFRRREKGAEGGRGAVRAEGGGTLMPVKLTRSGEINVRRTDDGESCWISGIDTTSNGNLILTDFSNSKVKLFSPDGQFLSSFSPSGPPWDVSVVDLSTAAVSVSTNREIVILGLGRGDQLSHRDTIYLQRVVRGIQSYNNNLIIICGTSTFSPRSVEMINMKGQVLWSTASHPNPLFDGARYLTVRSGSGPDSVIISDSSNQTITVLEAASGNLVKVCNVRGRKPLGLTLDDNGNTYVCYRSGDVSVWSGNMDVETRLSLQGGLVSEPWAMVYSSRRQEIILTCYKSDLIYCYKMLTWHSTGNMEIETCWTIHVKFVDSLWDIDILQQTTRLTWFIVIKC